MKLGQAKNGGEGDNGVCGGDNGDGGGMVVLVVVPACTKGIFASVHKFANWFRGKLLTRIFRTGERRSHSAVKICGSRS